MENKEEIWKDVVGYEGVYMISNFGRVKSLSRRIRFLQRDSKEELYRTSNTKILTSKSDNNGYKLVILRNGIKPKTIRVHTLVAQSFLKHENNNRKLVIDHIDNDRTNNHINNIQIITQRLNCSKDKKNKSSKYTGVHFCKTSNKWCAMIRFNGARKNLGLFKNEEDARDSYVKFLNKIKNEM